MAKEPTEAWFRPAMWWILFGIVVILIVAGYLFARSFYAPGNAPYPEVVNRICRTLPKGHYYVVEYKNEHGEIGGYTTRSDLEGPMPAHYGINGAFIRQVELPGRQNAAEEAAAMVWIQSLTRQFPLQTMYSCDSYDIRVIMR
jgi:hypothetical protein